MRKGRPAKIITNEECERLNSLRIFYSSRGFKREELYNLLREELGWKNNNVIQKILNEIFIHVDRTTYCFPKEPVYIKKLQKVFDDIRKERQENYSPKQPRIEVVELEEVKDPIQDAIKLLKKNGYKITREYFNVAEALKNPDMPASTFIKVEEF